MRELFHTILALSDIKAASAALCLMYDIGNLEIAAVANCLFQSVYVTDSDLEATRFGQTDFCHVFAVT
jgi:hypothetical protein